MTDKKNKNSERNAIDDWEALKVILDENPSLKQRVLHRLRELRRKRSDEGIKVSRREQLENEREQKRK